ncbi:hypothetical protein K8T06_02210 [bacterium]|nr:hypothetical protein [bacterium]
MKFRFSNQTETIDMETIQVSKVVTVAEIGTIVFCEKDPDPLWPKCELSVRITDPAGESLTASAEVKFAQSTVLGEVMILIIPDLKQNQVPIGSIIDAIEIPNT